MVFTLVDFVPRNGIGRSHQASLPFGAQENAIAMDGVGRGVRVILMAPGRTVLGEIGYPLPHGYKLIAGPEHGIQVLAFLTDLAMVPGEPVAARHAQAVQTDADKDVVAEGDINER